MAINPHQYDSVPASERTAFCECPQCLATAWAPDEKDKTEALLEALRVGFLDLQNEIIKLRKELASVTVGAPDGTD